MFQVLGTQLGIRETSPSPQRACGPDKYIQPQLRMKPIKTGWGEGAEERRLRGLHRGPHALFFFQKQRRGPGRAVCSKVTQPANRRLKFKVSNSSPGTVLLPWGEATNTCSRHSTGFSRARYRESRWCFQPCK